MTTVKVKFRASTVQGKEGKLYYKVTHNRLARQIKSTYKIYPAEWDEKAESIAMDGAGQERLTYLKDVDNHVRQDMAQLTRIVASLDKKGTSYTSDDVVRMFDGETTDGFASNARVYIERLEEEKRPKVANYKSALNSFLQFTNGKDIPITEITTTVIKDYEDWLLDKGLVRNSTSAYMRSLQAIYKHLMAEQHLKITDNPFSVVYRGIDKVEKNTLNLEQIRLIKDADLRDKPKMAYARDLFMFAFYTHASMVDIAYMKPQDIKMGVLFYKNHRGGETEMVKWEKVMSEIVQRYALSCKGYLLPIITDESEATLQHKRASNKVNNQLAKLGESIGLPFKLAMDVARDSWQAISRSYFDRVNGMILADLQGNISDTATTSNPKNVENKADSHSPNKTTPVENEEVSVIEVDTKAVEQLTQPTEQSDDENGLPNIPEESSKDKETQQEEIKDIKPKRIKKMQDVSPRKSIKQDNLWNAKWQAYMDYLDKNKRRPSKYKKEDMVLVDWFRHSKKLLRRGLMKADRIEKFQQLLDEAKRVLRKTGNSYASGESTDRKIEADENGIETTSKEPDSSVRWMQRYNDYVKFIESNGRIPSSSISAPKDERTLYMWLYNKKLRLKKGTLIDREKVLLAKLLPGGDIYEKYVTVRKAGKTKVAGLAKRKGQASDFHLYDYQQDMKDRIEDAFKSHKSVMVQMPTGTGKTHVVAAVVKDYISKDDNGYVWVVAHRRELVKQMRQTLALYLNKVERKRVVVTSIQWLTKHHTEVKEKPILIIIDEAHHAVAKTYASVLNAYPKAKRLGVTATPYRLSGEGFGDLFDILLTSWNIRAFISKGRLCSYDYYEIDNDSPEMGKIRGLSKRGADGDYQTKELEQSFNDQISIQRLYAAYSKYAQGKHGFVYAISIAHAEHIAEFYRSQGVNAIAVSSRTPEKVRDKIMSDFKDGKITVLVSVDLISEGYDAPDAELIQIARPTLSLSKYLQMVGRGLRTAEGKQYCVIIDNVGLANRFGMPDRERDWSRYFNGTDKDGETSFLGSSLNAIADAIRANAGQKGGDMHLAFSHDQMAKELNAIDSLRIVENKKGQKGLYDDKGNELLEQAYNDITISPEGIVRAAITHGKVDWFDVVNDVIYRKKPILEHIGDVPMAIVDGFFFPRIKSKWITQNTQISNDNMGGLYEAGLKWTNMWHKDIEYGQDTYYIPWHGVQKVYKIESDTSFGTRRLVDEDENMYLQRNPDSEVIPVKDSKEADTIINSWKSEFDEFEERAKDYPISYVKVSNLPSCGFTLEKEEGSIIEVVSPEGKKFWVDNLTRRKFNSKPRASRKGKAKILLVDDFVFIRNNEQLYPVQYWQVEVDNYGDYWIIGEHQQGKIDYWHRYKTEWWWKKD